MGTKESKYNYSAWEYCGDNTTRANINLYYAMISNTLPDIDACACCSKMSCAQYWIYNLDTMHVKTVCDECVLEYKAKPRRCIRCNSRTNNTKYRYCNDCGKIKYVKLNGKYIYKFDLMTQRIICEVCNDVYDIAESYNSRSHADAANMVYACSQIGDDIIHGHCTNNTCTKAYTRLDRRIESIKKQYKHAMM